MRPTTKDLAKAAGVSLATVDRVLNGRSGVRQKTVDAVNDAITRIGFERNQVAATLARQRGYRFGFVVPRSGDEFLSVIIKHISEFDQASRAEMIQTKIVRIDEHDPHRAARTLSRLSASEYDGIAIMAPETPQIRDALYRMRERGIQTVAIVSNQQEEDGQSFVGIDNVAAGATAGRLMARFLGTQSGDIIILAETMQSRDSLERRLGFDRVMSPGYPQFHALPTLETHGYPERTKLVLENAFAAHPDIVGLYIMGSEARLAIECARKLNPDKKLITIAHERTPSTEQALRDNTLDALINQDPGHIVRSAIRTLRAKCENRETLASQERIRIEILISENL
ncbi:MULTISPECIES: LacI family DNA-binding transcriptional regulator [unclassified Thalassospira]|uniref:LacI family DNA-binding transcriptional regulator n=1 Tax=unclassified Thalassospira TaxID=2648997 RepID=UPI0025F96A79|nr:MULTISPECIES: LacI family DNA-binding transcriptional regulator [unclassified Thalassospira]|tara:strand:- start:1795 stop:2817 length:1023 start_codon:yes stop_codon:yes gene_type:complete